DEQGAVVPYGVGEDLLSKDRARIAVVERDEYPLVPGPFENPCRQGGDHGDGARPRHALDNAGVVDLQDGNPRDPGRPGEEGIEIRDDRLNPEGAEAIHEPYHLDGEAEKQREGTEDRGEQEHSLPPLLETEMKDPVVGSLSHLRDNEIPGCVGNEIGDLVLLLQKG